MCVCGSSVGTYDVEGKGNEAMVSAQDTERLLPLHQCKEVICHRLTVEKVVDTEKEVPVRIKDRSDCTFSTNEGKPVVRVTLMALQDVCNLPHYTADTTDLKSTSSGLAADWLNKLQSTNRSENKPQVVCDKREKKRMRIIYCVRDTFMKYCQQVSVCPHQLSVRNQGRS